jgi:hypothetical protein
MAEARLTPGKRRKEGVLAQNPLVTSSPKAFGDSRPSNKRSIRRVRLPCANRAHNHNTSNLLKINQEPLKSLPSGRAGKRSVYVFFSVSFGSTPARSLARR